MYLLCKDMMKDMPMVILGMKLLLLPEIILKDIDLDILKLSLISIELQ
jgi:hypothetical protein